MSPQAQTLSSAVCMSWSTTIAPLEISKPHSLSGPSAVELSRARSRVAVDLLHAALRLGMEDRDALDRAVAGHVGDLVGRRAVDAAVLGRLMTWCHRGLVAAAKPSRRCSRTLAAPSRQVQRPVQGRVAAAHDDDVLAVDLGLLGHAVVGAALPRADVGARELLGLEAPWPPRGRPRSASLVGVRTTRSVLVGDSWAVVSVPGRRPAGLRLQLDDRCRRGCRGLRQGRVPSHFSGSSGSSWPPRQRSMMALASRIPAQNARQATPRDDGDVADLVDVCAREGTRRRAPSSALERALDRGGDAGEASACRAGCRPTPRSSAGAARGRGSRAGSSVSKATTNSWSSRPNE